MSDRVAARRFLRLVLVVSVIANAAAVAVVQGERELRPFAVASTLDRYRFELTDDIATYGTTIQTLHERVRAEAEQ